MATSARTPVPTVPEVRELLGEIAEGKTDAEIEALRDRFMDFARAFVAIARPTAPPAEARS
jgi:hypothetical protein